ncbi:HNH endonuclease [Lactobacillus terrae]|uniref:HNH endonuclease n=1 Tax=Lactobacillus terrae TaxID=2269374 RepID=UPI000C1B7AFC|nr:HNH endonuclease [Lactobacillus terrae]
MKPKKIVFKNGKRVLVDFDEVSRSETDKAYNNKRQYDNPEYVDFYHSKEWRLLRQEALTRDYETCVRCGLNGQMVDHILPSKLFWELRNNINNLETLCNSCHYVKTKREQRREQYTAMAMKITILKGDNPEAIHDYIGGHVSGNDLVIDIQELERLLSGSSYLTKNNKSNKQSSEREVKQETNIVHEYSTLLYEMLLRKITKEDSFRRVWIVDMSNDRRLKTLLSSFDVSIVKI